MTERSVLHQDPPAPPRGWSVKNGTECGSFRIVRPMAFGGMGEVYEGVHTAFVGRRVALKFLLSRADPRDYEQRFMEEMEVLFSINHPNVVRLFDANFLTDASHPGGRRPWMAMELLEGGTLAETLELATRFEVVPALQILAQVANGLRAAHDLGVIHRDIKPTNVFYTSTNVAKVIDFGTCKIPNAGPGTFTKRRTTEPHRLLGTEVYMAPEQISGYELDPRADIFSLGVTAYEILSGTHPFFDRRSARPTPAQAIFRICSWDPQPLSQLAPGCPKRASAMVGRMLAKKVEERHASMREVFEERCDIIDELSPRLSRTSHSHVGYELSGSRAASPAPATPVATESSPRASFAAQVSTEPMLPQVTAAALASLTRSPAPLPARGKYGTELMR